MDNFPRIVAEKNIYDNYRYNGKKKPYYRSRRHGSFVASKTTIARDHIQTLTMPTKIPIYAYRYSDIRIQKSFLSKPAKIFQIKCFYITLFILFIYCLYLKGKYFFHRLG